MKYYKLPKLKTCNIIIIPRKYGVTYAIKEYIERTTNNERNKKKLSKEVQK